MKYKQIMLVSIIIILLLAAGCSQASVLTQENDVNSETASSPCSESDSIFIGNPAAYYCTNIMGYDYQTITEEDGSQNGICIMPDGNACDQWAFYSGECGAEYSYCVQEGMDIETRSDGNDPYSSVYSVCTDSADRSEIKISDLIDFETTQSDSLPVESGTRSDDLVNVSDEELASLPTHFDWRDIDGENWMSPVKNQGSCGSCWAFSALGVMEAYYNFINNDPDYNMDFAEEYLVSDCVKHGCNGGHSFNSLEYIRDVGIVEETCMPYTATDSACSTLCDDPEWYSIDQVFWEYYTLDVDMLKYLIVNYGPVSVYFKIGMGSFDEEDVLYCPDLDRGDIDHAVVAVGYDDAGEYWIVKNSWGSTWGADGDGYFKVGYNECNIDSTVYVYIPSETNNTYLPLVSQPGTAEFTTTPVLTYPQEGNTVNTLKPTITWTVNDNLDDWTYLYYGISPDYHLHEHSGGVSGYGSAAGAGSFTLDENLKEGTTYYMHVAYNYRNENYFRVMGPYSGTISFTTGTGFDVPGEPVLTFPTDGSTLEGTSVTLDWDPVEFADEYEIIILWEMEGYDGYWMGITYTISTDELSLIDLNPYTEYQWFLRGSNDEAWGEYSETWTFTTGAESSSGTQTGEQAAHEMFIINEDGELIPYEAFIKKAP